MDSIVKKRGRKRKFNDLERKILNRAKYVVNRRQKTVYIGDQIVSSSHIRCQPNKIFNLITFMTQAKL